MRISDWSSDVCSSDLLGLIVGNLIGGIAAAVAYNLALAGHSFLFFVTVLLAASLAFAGRIVTAGDRAPVYAIALATFVLRSEERRVGKGWVSKCKSGGSPHN